jgi:hypothetical protein
VSVFAELCGALKSVLCNKIGLIMNSNLASEIGEGFAPPKVA